MLFPFFLSSIYWALEVAQQVVRIETLLIHPDQRDSHHILTYYADVFNAIALLNVRIRSKARKLDF